MKITRNTTKATLAALFAGAALSTQAFAQSNSVPTPIVGFSTVTAAANGGSGVRYSLVAANLLNSPSWAGTLNGSLQAASNSFTSGAFNAGSVYPKFYVEILEGSAAGSQADILSNTADTLTVDGQAAFQTAVGSGVRVVIRKHRTLPEIFGGTSGAAGATDVVISKGSSASLADIVIIREDGNSKTFYYSSSTLRPGWRDQSLNAASDRPIYPNQGLMIGRKSNTAASITVTGQVNENVTFYDLPAGSNLVTLPIPANSTLPQIFGGSSGGTGATDVKIQKGSSVSSSDNLLVAKANGTYDTYYYSTSSLRPGWRDSSGALASTKVLDGAVAFFIKKVSNGSLTLPSMVTN